MNPVVPGSRWFPALAAVLWLGVSAPAVGQAPFVLSESGWATGGTGTGGSFSMTAGTSASRSGPLLGGPFTLEGQVGTPSTVRASGPAPVLAYERTARGTLLLRYSGTGAVVVEAAERLGGSPARTVWSRVTLAPGPAGLGVLGEVTPGGAQQFFRLRRP